MSLVIDRQRADVPIGELPQFFRLALAEEHFEDAKVRESRDEATLVQNAPNLMRPVGFTERAPHVSKILTYSTDSNRHRRWFQVLGNAGDDLLGQIPHRALQYPLLAAKQHGEALI